VRRGVGSALIASVKKDAKADGVERLSSLSTLTAVPFYLAQGFRVLRPVDLSFGAGVRFPAVEMELVL
jgi:N-acetylglutamate synthase-like GNAT family acetyltransferase